MISHVTFRKQQIIQYREHVVCEEAAEMKVNMVQCPAHVERYLK